MSAPLALDPGAAWVKRVRLEGEAPHAWPDLRRGRLRTPRAALGDGPAAGLHEAWLEAGRPAAVSLVAADEAGLAGLRAAAEAAAPGARVLVLPAALAAALEAAASGEEPPARDAVLDLGHHAVRLQALEWRRWEGVAYPRAVGAATSVPLGGGRLDEELAAVARVEGGGAAAPAASGFAELKELLGAARGPFLRPLEGGGLVELPAREAGEALRAWLEGLRSALLSLVEAAREAGAARVLAVGGLLELGPVRELVTRVFAGGPRLVLVRAPGFAACRGAARALLRPPGPVAAHALGVPVRAGGRIELRPLVPAGAALDGARFGPLELRAAPGDAAEVAVHLLAPDGDGAWVARLPSGERLSVTWRWSWEAGWSCLSAGGEVPATPLDAAGAAALREALTLDWAAHGRELPLDLALVFRATRALPAGLTLAAAAAERAFQAALEAAPGARLRGIATGDHPQGHLTPAFLTRVAPAWVGDPAAAAAFVREAQGAAVDGIDPEEAFECALREAGRLDWRPDANRVLLVLADAPPHTPEAPPYCPVDWRAEAAALRAAGVRLLPVHVVVGGLPPALRQRTLAFLEGLGPTCAVRAGALEELAAAVRAAAVVRAPDARAQALLARVAVEAAS